jgi:hypothetical protein
MWVVKGISGDRFDWAYFRAHACIEAGICISSIMPENLIVTHSLILSFTYDRIIDRDKELRIGYHEANSATAKDIKAPFG